jgi:DNA ligase-1
MLAAPARISPSRHCDDPTRHARRRSPAAPGRPAAGARRGWLSNLHLGARDPASGLALRFARVKGYRPDKRAEEAGTIDAVRALYAEQVARAAA